MLRCFRTGGSSKEVNDVVTTFQAGVYERPNQRSAALVLSYHIFYWFVVCLHLILRLKICWPDSLSTGSQNPAAAKVVLTVTAAWSYSEQIQNRMKTEMLKLKPAVAERENPSLRFNFVCYYSAVITDFSQIFVTLKTVPKVFCMKYLCLYTELINHRLILASLWPMTWTWVSRASSTVTTAEMMALQSLRTFGSFADF